MRRRTFGGRNITALADSYFPFAMFQLQEIKFRLLEQFQDFEHVIFAKFHQHPPAFEFAIAAHDRGLAYRVAMENLTVPALSSSWRGWAKIERK